MNLEDLVEKITREVMDTMDGKGNPAPAAQPASGTSAPSNFPSATAAKSVILLAGCNQLTPEVLRSAASFLRKKNLQVTVAAAPGAAAGSMDGFSVIRCGSYKDCAAAVRNADMAAILLSNTASVSKLANLLVDGFDVEGALAALEAGKEVWGLKVMKGLPGPLQNKVQGFFREIESFGIKVADISGDISETQSFSPVRAEPVSPVSSVCSASSEEGCAGCGLCANLNTAEVKNVINEGAERVSAAPGIKMVPADVAGMIDHTLLKPDATKEKVLKLCEEARQYKFASCCVNPTWVPLVAECLKGSPVKTCVVIGFPLGANSSVVKAMETRDAIAAGADEVDMVINVGALKAGDYDLVLKDIEAVVQAAQGRIVKVILETALLTDAEKIKACHLSKQAGADFVKTSTGFGPGGATVEDIALMRKTVGKYMGVKASGGIRDFEKAEQMIRAGATRIGASASIAIVKGTPSKSGSGY